MEIISLVKLAKAGDKDAFASLYEQIYTELYRFAYFMLSQSQDAEDAVSETVIDAFKGIRNLKDEKTFKHWMFKILSIKCKRKMAEYYEKKVPLEEVGDIKADEKYSNEWIDFKNALSALSYEERCIVVYSIVGGYNSKEIARLMDMNNNTVRTKLNRAINKMKIRMA